MLKTRYLVIIAFYSLLWLSVIEARNADINTNKEKFAISGYDPVAYFTQKKAIKGSKKYKYKWREATWLFSSNKNKRLFKKNPKKYAPVYGGYCAYAVSRNYSQVTRPDTAWTIYKDRLYLNFNKKIKKIWSSKKNSYIKKANKNWPDSLENNPPKR